jgi:hypothetical protein
MFGTYHLYLQKLNHFKQEVELQLDNAFTRLTDEMRGELHHFAYEAINDMKSDVFRSACKPIEGAIMVVQANDNQTYSFKVVRIGREKTPSPK